MQNPKCKLQTPSGWRRQGDEGGDKHPVAATDSVFAFLLLHFELHASEASYFTASTAFIASSNGIVSSFAVPASSALAPNTSFPALANVTVYIFVLS
jgi:hypothetical protein